MSWSRYVALGDSFTEGMDDPYADGVFRGWADLVAGRLNELSGGDFGYANLAIRGRLYDAIVGEQLEPALAMKPDLVSFAAGANDVLRRRCDPPALMARFDATVARLRATGADVLLFRFADVMSRLPGNNLVAPRIRYLNQAVGDVAAKNGARLVDLWNDHEYANPALWSIDRLHLSAAGHRRTAAHVLAALDVPADPTWWDLPPWPERRSWLVTKGDDLAWAGRYLAPWIKRRLTGRSSGDSVTAKRPTMGPI
ncbi:SGNH/GDSL hydrolase family protein [Catellatospora tritici]|uniref:SGNH/GDSL hydrolase family protein n=1 Tax=Catellatospora tritici TaxID=2851566 RepID=UPI001C2D19E7|nr:SGNH/GDSL hydrolase family protein [Catellatospora tritici]MBV1853253.1 SGNH/GDSL hydrolase family protein [Catellatospora tritici]